MFDDLVYRFQPIYEFCLTVNPYLAIIALGVLGFRVLPTIFYLGMPTALARILFGGYIFATALGSWENKRLDNEATYASPIFTTLHLGVITLFVFWDFGLKKGMEDKARSQGKIRTRKEDA